MSTINPEFDSDASQHASAVRKPAVRTWAWALVLFAAGLSITSGHAALLGHGAFYLFKQMARAQYQLHQASQNLNADGHAEYAVLMHGIDANLALREFLAGEAGWGARASSLPGWTIVTAPADTPRVVPKLRQQPFARAVLRNRGVWICH
jgi:hypothetical protein